MDEIVNGMKANGIKILAILDHNTMNNTLPPNLDFNLPQWTEVVQNVMKTDAAKRVDAWEIWNEPNADQFQFGYMNGDSQNYFEMLRVAHEIIEKNSPNAIVIAAGLSPSKEFGDWSQWLTDFSNLSPQTYFDYQGVHLYDDTEVNLRTINQTKQIMDVEYVWVTEIGKPSAPINDFSAEAQASYLESNFQMLNNNVKCPIFWYQLKDEADDSSNKECNFGLFDVNNNPKAASNSFTMFTFTS